MYYEVKAVIFDLDGVITDTANYHYRAWKKLAIELDIYFDKTINESLKGVSRLASLEVILKNSKRLFSNEEKNMLAARKNDYYRKLIETITPVDIYPGVLNVFKTLKEKSIKIGLASVSKNAFTVIDKLKIRKYFDYIVDAAKIKNSKPDPEIFLNAAENLNINAKNCVGIEDSSAGIKAIKAAAMYAVGIGNSELLKDADIVLKSLVDFNINNLSIKPAL